MDEAANPMLHFNALELYDFINSANFDQYINLIRSDQADHENQAVQFGDCTIDDHLGLMDGCLVDNQFGASCIIATPGPGELFGTFNGVISTTGQSDPNSMMLDTLASSFDGEMKGEEKEEDNDVEDYSATNITTTTSTGKTKRQKIDRSKTLISERRRRGRMKEKLYALRSLVPYITKMDKASIIGDALHYVQDLQMQAKKLKDEIAGLEGSVVGQERSQGFINIVNPRNINQFPNNNQLISKKIIQMDLFQMEEKGYYMKLSCSKGEGVTTSLYKVLESLSSFNIQSSNLASTADEAFVLTVTLNVKECVREMSLPNLKLWVVGALLNHGFEFRSPFRHN